MIGPIKVTLEVDAASIALTAEELQLLEMTAALWNGFSALPDKHPSDAEEMQRDIHSIQHRIMARCAVRAHRAMFVQEASNA